MKVVPGYPWRASFALILLHLDVERLYMAHFTLGSGSRVTLGLSHPGGRVTLGIERVESEGRVALGVESPWG